MIVFEGDSVACCDYPEMVANYYHMPFNNQATYQATTRELRHRLSSIDAEWYACCIGQWSSTHQEYQPFMDDLHFICKHLHSSGTKIVLITPPPSIPQTEWSAQVVRDTAKIFNTALVDLHQKMQGLDLSYYNPDTVSCHFNKKGSAFVLQCFMESTNFYRGFP